MEGDDDDVVMERMEGTPAVGHWPQMLGKDHDGEVEVEIVGDADVQVWDPDVEFLDVELVHDVDSLDIEMVHDVGPLDAEMVHEA